MDFKSLCDYREAPELDHGLPMRLVSVPFNIDLSRAVWAGSGWAHFPLPDFSLCVWGLWVLLSDGSCLRSEIREATLICGKITSRVGVGEPEI